MIRSRFLAPVFLAACALLAGSARAQSTLTLTDTIGDANAVSVAQGQSFDIIALLTTSSPSIGLSFFLEATDSSNLFRIVGRDTSLTPFSDLASDTATVTSSNGFLNPRNDDDLGGTVPGAAAPAGSFTVSVFTLQAGLFAPTGTYILRPSLDAVVTGVAFGEETPVGNTYSVTITAAQAAPEPGTLALTLMGLSSIALVRRARTAR